MFRPRQARRRYLPASSWGAKELEAALKKDGHLKDGSLRGYLNKYGSEVAKGGASAAGLEGMRSLFTGLSDWLSGGGTEAFPDVFGGLG